MGDLMVASLAAMLRDRGYATLDFDGVDLARDLARLRQADAAAILAYNGMLLEASVGHGGSVWDDAGIPCVAWLVDHPIYHLPRLTGRSRLVLPACVDASHTRFLRDWGLSGHSRELYHFAIGDPEDAPAGGRDIDVLFPANVADPEALRSEWVALPGPLLSVLEQSTAECLFRGDGDLVDIIGATCEELGIADPEAVGVAVGYLF